MCFCLLSFVIAPLIGALGTRLDADYSVGYRLVLRWPACNDTHLPVSIFITGCFTYHPTQFFCQV